MTGLPWTASATTARYGYGGQTTTRTGRSPTPFATAAARSRPLAAVVNIFQLPATIGVRDIGHSQRLRNRLAHHAGQLPQLVHELVEPVGQQCLRPVGERLF